MMRKLSAFIQVSLDGYFEDADGEMQWAHTGAADPEWREFTSGNARGGGELLFGRITYEMMAGYWPSSLAAQRDPVVAERMNMLPKTVFSRTLSNPEWGNTKVVSDHIEAAVMEMKDISGPDMVILGSGSIVAQLGEARLIDEYQIVVNPVVLGEGRTPFDGIQKPLALRLTKSREFRNGRVLLSYVPE